MNGFLDVGKPQQLLIKHLLDRPLGWAPRQEIVYRDLHTHTYLDFHMRVQRLARLLERLGVRRGDRIGVMDWDSHRYLELYFAVPMLGAVLHTVNVRLAPDQVLYTLTDAEDSLLLAHADFLPLVEPMLPRLPMVRTAIRITDDKSQTEARAGFAGEYEQMLAGEQARFDFPDFDENSIATLFYTTGTTGEPKGVYFSHRQIVLHTLATGLTLAASREPLGIDDRDVYMPLTPMFHVHAWGIPYLATLLGMKQVYPGRYDPQMLAKMVALHRPSFTHCVPTILQMVLQHPAFAGLDLTGWKIVIGGSALTQALLMQALERGIRILAGYGMSETCPVIALAQLKQEMDDLGPEKRAGVLTRTGFPIALVRAGAVDFQGRPLPPGAEHIGELVLQAPWLTPGYFKNEAGSGELWRGGWLHTGDVAYIDAEGYIRITDRMKDVIKIGGEWISSLELENALSRHPAVKEVAVIGVPDAKWGERPRAVIALKDEFRDKVSTKDLLAHLRTFVDSGQIHKRAILTKIHFAESLPHTSVGKLNKKALRAGAR